MSKLFYDLRSHNLGDWSLLRWLVTALLLAALAVAWIGRRQIVGFYGLMALLLFLAAFVLLILHQRFAVRGYIHFHPDAEARGPAPAPLGADEEVLLYASGPFEVQGKVHYFVALPARFSTFATREHAVMARVCPTRMLLVGQMPQKLVGMWYLFFRPNQLHAVEPGTFTFGNLHLPALRVTYDLPSQSEGKRAGADRRQAEAHLAFEDEPARLLVWADLLADLETA